MNKKYIVVVVHNPYGKNIGTSNRLPAIPEILSNKLFKTLKEAEEAAKEYKEKYLIERVKDRFHIDFNLFSNLYNYISEWSYLNDRKGIITKNFLSIDDNIKHFFKMFDIREYYTEKEYLEDCELYREIRWKDDPIISIFKIDSISLQGN